MKTRRHFFRMCGSPIRTVKASELDYLEVKTKKQLRVTDETAASLDRREAKVKQVTLAPAVLEPLRVDSGGTAIGYYGPPKAEDYAYPPHQADKSGPLLLDGARQAKIPLFMSDAFERKQQHKAALGEATPEPKPTATTAPVTAVPAIKHLKQREVRMTELSLQKVIGEGAFGKVYKALYKGRSVAVKVLIKQNLSDDVVSEFETEVKIMSLLNHPNICRLLGACLQPYNRALVIELAEKGSLWSVLRSGRSALTDAMRVKFMLDTARGMSYLHQFRRPILHRDLKSPNMLVQDDFSIKLSDFGLARVKTQIQTMTGNCGTVQWMAYVAGICYHLLLGLMLTPVACVVVLQTRGAGQPQVHREGRRVLIRHRYVGDLHGPLPARWPEPDPGRSERAQPRSSAHNPTQLPTCHRAAHAHVLDPRAEPSSVLCGAGQSHRKAQRHDTEAANHRDLDVLQ